MIIPLQALNPRHRKVAIEILKALDGISISDCCDILDVVNIYLGERVTDYDDLDETFFNFIDFDS